MQEREIILTWEAIYDLTDIIDYIERDFGKSRADRFEKGAVKKQSEKKRGFSIHICDLRILFLW